MRTPLRLGYWAAQLSAAFALLWFITFNMQDILSPVPAWQDLNAYAQAYSPLRLLYIYPSLLLPLTFIALFVCIHRLAPEHKKAWSQTGLAIGVVYAAMATINYNIQAVAVRQSLASGETTGVAMFIPDNPHSVFAALANSYVYMSIAMACTGMVFDGSGLQRGIRWCFLAQIVTAVGQIGFSMFGVPMPVFIVTSMVWVVGAPLGFVLLAALFRRNAWPPCGETPVTGGTTAR
ncbi:MAG: hypothetical protein GF331_03195 [Chitinivibrionales bacterium]|nr:hypothetical protein [Chitinivibrionales bacterium]